MWRLETLAEYSKTLFFFLPLPPGLQSASLPRIAMQGTTDKPAGEAVRQFEIGMAPVRKLSFSFFFSRGQSEGG